MASSVGQVNIIGNSLLSQLHAKQKANGQIQTSAASSLLPIPSPGSATIAGTQVTNQAAVDAGAKTAFQTQVIAQGQAATQSPAQAAGQAAVDKFRTFMNAAGQGMGAFVRAQVLASKGLTEQSFAQLPPDEQAKINDEIKKDVEQAVQKKKEEVAQKTGVPKELTGG